MRPRTTLALCALLGFAWYCCNGGWSTLLPTQTGWLRSEDLSQHFLGWLYFRRAPLGWPIGVLPDLGYPVGTTLGFMDANPLMSSLFRPLSPWLPKFFQFQGLWLASCFALQGLVGGFIARLVASRPSQQLMIAAMLAMAPPALLRVCHENLAAHWLLLAGIYLLLRPDTGPADARRACAVGGMLLAVSLGAHAYLAMMLIPLLVLAVGRRVISDRSLPLGYGIATVAAYAFLTGFVLWAYAFIGSGISQAEPGFGSQSADLTSLINPMGWSRIFPNQPINPDQFEGYAYLGLGGMVLAAWGLYGAMRQRLLPMAPNAWRYLTWLSVGYVILALSDTISWRGQTILALRPYTTPILPIISIFRASGRFMWVPYYTLLIAGVAALVRQLPGRAATVALAAVLVLQLADVRPDEMDVHTKLTRNEISPLSAKAWDLMDADYDHLAMVPPMFPSSKAACRWTYPWGYQLNFNFLAYGHDMSINSVYAGRANAPKIDAYCTDFWGQLEARKLDARTVYVVDGAYVALFSDPRMRATCRALDNAWVCVKDGQNTAFGAYLAAKS